MNKKLQTWISKKLSSMWKKWIGSMDFRDNLFWTNRNKLEKILILWSSLKESAITKINSKIYKKLLSRSWKILHIKHKNNWLSRKATWSPKYQRFVKTFAKEAKLPSWKNLKIILCFRKGWWNSVNTIWEGLDMDLKKLCKKATKSVKKKYFNKCLKGWKLRKLTKKFIKFSSLCTEN